MVLWASSKRYFIEIACSKSFSLHMGPWEENLDRFLTWVIDWVGLSASPLVLFCSHRLFLLPDRTEEAAQTQPSSGKITRSHRHSWWAAHREKSFLKPKTGLRDPGHQDPGPPCGYLLPPSAQWQMEHFFDFCPSVLNKASIEGIQLSTSWDSEGSDAVGDPILQQAHNCLTFASFLSILSPLSMPWLGQGSQMLLGGMPRGELACWRSWEPLWRKWPSPDGPIWTSLHTLLPLGLSPFSSVMYSSRRVLADRSELCLSVNWRALLTARLVLN